LIRRLFALNINSQTRAGLVIDPAGYINPQVIYNNALVIYNNPGNTVKG